MDVALGAVGFAALGPAWWAAGADGLRPETEVGIGGILPGLGLIVLPSPVALVVLVPELRGGLRAARGWAARGCAAMGWAALRAQAGAASDPPRGKRRRR